jgi:hypothetical protein
VNFSNKLRKPLIKVSSFLNFFEIKLNIDPNHPRSKTIFTPDESAFGVGLTHTRDSHEQWLPN